VEVPVTLHERMSRIRSVSKAERDAGPALRRLLGPLRHQPRGVYGRPDYADKARRVALFFDGSFWHGGPGYKAPRTNAAFWREKVRRNRARRVKVRKALRAAGWAVLEFWDSEVKNFTSR
jgi:DNA mismatch endonuclease (patch repair protein)